ncbi:WAP four-disulfide core domain protein 6 [Phoca vitulina]|uniref:WAP four-disulfide core domain protein 6 n=1 Tax=Phoca vitulina TaxID=9720 RepID=UPI0013965A35|nr:WAP four-disulfide core domain protein 6 [Phoca vitulina]
MGLLGLLPVLALFILLGGVQEPELVEGFFGKKCPRMRVPCGYTEIDQCAKNKPCPGKMKCCNFNCGKKCLDFSEVFAKQEIVGSSSDTKREKYGNPANWEL